MPSRSSRADPIDTGDFNSDGTLNGTDLLTWQRNPNLGDLATWQSGYGTAPASQLASVPEPSALILSVMGLGAFFGVRSRRLS